MGLSQPVAGGVLAMWLVAVGSGGPAPVGATPHQQGISQPATGQLNEDSQTLDSESNPALEQTHELNQQAIELYQQSRYSEAEPIYLHSLQIYREQLGEHHPDVATSLNNLALLYHDQGRYSNAELLYQQALEIRSEQLGERHLDVATVLNNIAALYQDQGRYNEADPFFLQALEIRHEQLGESHPLVATSLNNLALSYQNQGHHDEAEPLFLQALEIRREQLGERHLEVATSLNNLALLYRLQGRYDEAEPLFLQTLEIDQEQLGERHPEVATSLNNLASLYQDQGRYDEAEPLFLRALEISHEQLGEHHPDVAAILNNLALLHMDQGRYDEVESLFLQALKISHEQLGERHPEVAISLNNLAMLYIEQGRYDEVESLFLQALEISREQLGERHPQVATNMNNLALLYGYQGRYVEVESLFLKALEIYQEQLGERHPTVAISLNNLAELYRAQGRYSEAEPFYSQALEIHREHLGERHPQVATSLNNLANLYQDQGRYSEAEPLHRQALEMRHEQLGENHPVVVISLNDLANLYAKQGRYAEAESLALQVLEMSREQLWEHSPYVANSLNNLALLSQAQGKVNQSISYLQAGLDIEEQHLDLNLATLAEEQRQAYAAQRSNITTNVAISLHLQAAPNSPEAAQLALTTLLRRKGRILDAGTNSQQALRQNLTPEDQATLAQLTTVHQELADLVFNAPANVSAENYQARIARLEAEANELEATLARRSAAFRAESEPIEIATVQDRIPANGVLVEFVRYSPFDVAAEFRWGEARYAAYLLFPDGRIGAVDLGNAAEIDAAVQAFSGDLRTAALPATRANEEEGSASQLISALIFDPIAPYLTDREHLLISPDSQLNRIPFEALQTGAGGDYLVQHYQISYLNSGRDLLKFETIAPSTAPALVLANPDYDSTEAANTVASEDHRRSAELSQLQVGPLPGTAAEAEAIAPLLPNATVLTEDEATENVLKAAQAPRILHIATHGFFLPNVERSGEPESWLATRSSDNPLAAVDISIENPLLRSGLALAGFNARQSGSEDGVLTALEVANLNLFGTQLVVLSACETGLGDIVNGDGVYGLRRSFAIAGAESQLMSLWLVSDDGTQALMARYYEKLVSGMGRSEALRETQLEMIAEDGRYSHPYYWASFILAGDWRPLE